MKKGLLRCFMGCAICCLLVVAIVVIAYLVARPQDPKFQVDSFSISNFTAGNDSKVSFAADVRLTVGNPNMHLSISFGRGNAGVFYKSSSVAVTWTPAFSVGKKREASLNLSFGAAVVGSLKERDSVGFDVNLACNAGFQRSIWVLRRKGHLKVFCSGLVVGIPSNGTQGGGLSGGPKRCRVE